MAQTIELDDDSYAVLVRFKADGSAVVQTVDPRTGPGYPWTVMPITAAYEKAAVLHGSVRARLYARDDLALRSAIAAAGHAIGSRWLRFLERTRS